MTREQRRGSLAGQLQPRLVATVAVMAILVALTTSRGCSSLVKRFPLASSSTAPSPRHDSEIRNARPGRVEYREVGWICT